MKRIFISAVFVSLLMLGVGVFGNFGLSAGGLLPTAQAASGCSLRTLKGSYGYYVLGFFPGGVSSAVGLLTFDGAGTLTGSDTIAQSYGLIEARTITGIYTVNADCTGAFTWQVSGASGGTYGLTMVIVDKGKKIYFMLTTNPGLVSNFIAEKR